MTTRSATLWVASTAAGSNLVVYACPAATITLIKSILVQNPGANSATVYLTLVRPSTGVSLWVFQGPLAAGAWQKIDCWVVLQPGDQVYQYGIGNSITGWASGALLPQPSA